MKQKVIQTVYAFVVVLLLVGGGVSCRSHTDTASGVYSNPAKGFSIIFPKDWTIKEGDSDKALIVVGLSPPQEGRGDSFRENVSVNDEALPGSLTVQQYLDAVLRHLKDLPDFKEVERGEITIDGKPALWLLATYLSKRGVGLKVIQYYVIQGTTAYLVTGTALQDTFEKYRSLFDQTAKSLKITKK